MTDRQILTYIGFKYGMFLILMYFMIDSVGVEGWGVFTLLFAVFATRDFVQGTRLMNTYIKIRKNRKK